MTLDPHQLEAVEYLLNNPRNMLADAPGVGKTAPGIVASAVSGPKLMIGCRSVARTNWRREVSTWRPDLEDKDLMIVSHDSLAVNPETVFRAKQFAPDVLIIDEAHHCFPAEVEVFTDEGPIPFSAIMQGRGENVLSMDTHTGEVQWRGILRRFSNPPRPLVRVVHSHGILVCTEDHHVWANNRYVKAKDLSGGEELRSLRNKVLDEEQGASDSAFLLSKVRDAGEHARPDGAAICEADSEMRGVWGRVYGGEVHENAVLREKLCSAVADEAAGATGADNGEDDSCEQNQASYAREKVSRFECPNEGAEPNAHARDKGENACGAGGSAVSRAPRREREVYAGRASGASPKAGLGYGDYCENRGAKGSYAKTPAPLQNRHRGPGFEDCGGSGRTESRLLQGQGRRPAEGYGTSSSRVERVEIQEYRGEGQCGALRRAGESVYCIEVEGNGNFFADGVLVSNCKSREAKRTQAYYGPRCDGRAGIVERVPCVWPMSGTPMPSNASEMWTHLRALQPDLITLPSATAPMDFMQFIGRYLNFDIGTYGPRYWGNKKENLDELRRVLRSFMLRRTEGTVKLPPLNFEAVIVDCPMAKEVLRAMQELSSEKSVRVLADSLAFAEASGADFVWSAPDSAMGELRRILGEVKAPVVGKLIAEELDDNAYNKVVVFAYHHSVIEILHDQLIEFHPVLLTGDTSQRRRQEAIDSFQNDSHARVFIGQIQACSESITLTAAHHVVFCEDDWRPDAIIQAAARCRRRGQKEVVHARVYGLANSLDEGLARVRVRKAKMTKEIQNA